ncbi:MAG: indolepyruvate oxidoreductase subunit beta [Clostridiales bacterium]|nr:indolepyruvate oxidoreductase subunit beta [Clostridiales bacterium]
MTDCIITGVGGQGIILLSRLIGAAAMEKGFGVRGTETIGMAQRGGSVVSHVRIGDGVMSPLIPLKNADILLALEPFEAVRNLHYLKEDGIVFSLDKPVRTQTKPLTDPKDGGYEISESIGYLKRNVKRLELISYDSLAKAAKNVKAVNTAFLGFVVEKGVFPFNTEDIERAMRARIPEKYLEMNLEALRGFGK